MRGISPVIATVIILAVTIAIAVAVIGWITGLFGATTGGTEQLQIMPDSYINATSNVLHLHVVNKGGDATIYKIEVAGLYTVAAGDPNSKIATGTSNIANDDSISFNTMDKLTINAGADVYIFANNTATDVPRAVAGTVYAVKIYTANGNVFTASVMAKS